MKCPNCGHENSHGVQYCNNCGSRLTPKRKIGLWIWLMAGVGVLLIIIAVIPLYKRETFNPNTAWEKWANNSMNLITPDYNALIQYQPWAPPAYQDIINADALQLETDANNCLSEGNNLTASPEMQSYFQSFKDALQDFKVGASYLTSNNPENMASSNDSQALTCFQNANSFLDTADLALNSLK